jgi:hypothetical protein
LENGIKFVLREGENHKSYPILHTGNMASYVLPKTGGTLTGDLYLLTGDNDRYIWFDYSENTSSMGASWRIGHRGSGSGDANHFVI